MQECEGQLGLGTEGVGRLVWGKKMETARNGQDREGCCRDGRPGNGKKLARTDGPRVVYGKDVWKALMQRF